MSVPASAPLYDVMLRLERAIIAMAALTSSDRAASDTCVTASLSLAAASFRDMTRGALNWVIVSTDRVSSRLNTRHADIEAKSAHAIFVNSHAVAAMAVNR